MKSNNEMVGMMNKNTMGTMMRIIEYNGWDNLIVEFLDEHKFKIRTTYQSFINGCVRNPYDKSIYGVGYIGEGVYSCTNTPKIYNTWNSMLARCYNPKNKNHINAYKDCKVDERFHNLQDFGLWFDENYYEVGNERMTLDKDILYKGNKIYSPDTCIFTPIRINNLFGNNSIRRGEYLKGVTFCKRAQKYMARCWIIDENNNRKNIGLGYYETEIEAFNAYKTFKEQYIKIVAKEYYGKIPERLFNALIRYKIDIND